MALTDEQILTKFQNTKRLPPASQLLGFEMLSLSVEGGWVETAFTARPEFVNPAGNVQGGFITGMLDEAMSVAAFVKSGMTHVVPTLQMTVSFLNPVPVGRLYARGEVLRFGRNTTQLQGTLRLADGTIAATALASTAVRELKRG
jgi:uncharacterized protein (TIGR00369 family)